MTSLIKQFITFNGRLYLIRKIIKEEHKPIIDVWKEHLRADTVFKKDGLLYFVEIVEDLEIIP